MSNANVPNSKRGRRWFWLIAAIVLVGSVAWTAYWVSLRYTHSISNDAFIESHLINVAPQVAGTVVEMCVQEQGLVKKGDLLAVVDPSTYQREVNLASARREVAEAALKKSDADLKLLEAEVPKRITIAELKLAIAQEDEAKAGDALEMVTQDVEKGIAAAKHAVEGARAGFVLAEEDYARYGALFKDGSVSERKYEEATKNFQSTQADVKVAQARLGQTEANRKQIQIAAQGLKSAKHAVAEARTTVELARLGNLQIAAAERLVAERKQTVTEANRNLELAQQNLDYTRIVAPYDGVIAKKWRHLGDYAHTGDPVFSMYNPELLYVTVNLEETLLEGVNPGNEAELRVDAFREPFRGRVIWIGSATSANFSLIPRDVSSGEFTYVVQRVPTRIGFLSDPRRPQLRPGLSVTVSIKHGLGDPEWAAQALKQERAIEGIPEKNR